MQLGQDTLEKNLYWMELGMKALRNKMLSPPRKKCVISAAIQIELNTKTPGLFYLHCISRCRSVLVNPAHRYSLLRIFYRSDQSL